MDPLRVREGPAVALDRLGAGWSRSQVFGADVRDIGIDEAQSALRAAGCTPVALCGGRIVNDLVADNEVKQEPAWFEDLLRLELALHDREPFNCIGAYWHLLATRDRPGLDAVPSPTRDWDLTAVPPVALVSCGDEGVGWDNRAPTACPRHRDYGGEGEPGGAE